MVKNRKNFDEQELNLFLQHVFFNCQCTVVVIVVSIVLELVMRLYVPGRGLNKFRGSYLELVSF